MAGEQRSPAEQLKQYDEMVADRQSCIEYYRNELEKAKRDLKQAEAKRESYIRCAGLSIEQIARLS